MAIKTQQKIITLWLVFLLGLLFHAQLGLMPLFHNLSVAEFSAQSTAEIIPIMWLMLGFFTLPIAAIMATAFTDSQRYRIVHFGLTVVYSVLNFFHLVADLIVPPIVWYQIALMAILLMIGLLLNLMSYQWIKQRTFKTVSLAKNLL
jgi:hypothetical protein